MRRRSLARVGPLSGRTPAVVLVPPHRLMGRVVGADTTGAEPTKCAGPGVCSSVSIT